MKRHHATRRRRLTALAAGVAVTAAVAASAAGLGGLSADRIGAENTVVLDAADGLHLSWGAPTYDDGVGGYTVTSVTLTTSGSIPLPDVAAGATVKVALLDENDDPVSESSSVTGGGSAYTVTFPTPVDVEAVVAAAVVVSE